MELPLTPERGQPPTSPWSKEALHYRWAGSPFLLLLLFSKWFRLVLLAVVLAAIAAAVLLPKIWRVTPEGVRPEVKISLLDYAQNWSLKRTARSQEKEGNAPAALTAWRSAWGNNPGDEEALRGVLGVLPQLPDATHHGDLALRAATWMVLMGRTNRTDIAVVATALVHCGLGERALALLEPTQDPLSPALEQACLMALASAGRFSEFAARFRANPALLERRSLTNTAPAPGPKAEDARHFELFADAYLAGWGSGQEAEAALARLQAAQQERVTESMAYELEFMIRSSRDDLDGCAKILRDLNALGQAPVKLHAAYWTQLLRAGRDAEAMELADSTVLLPQNPLDLERLAVIETALGLWERADRRLQEAAANPALRADMAVRQARFLIGAQHWDELRQLALMIRSEPVFRIRLEAYGAYLEGLVAWREQRASEAEASFAEVAKQGISDPPLALEVAEGMLSMNAPASAEALLAPLLSKELADPKYWHLLMRCALVQRSEDLLWETTSKLILLDPKNPIVVNNYAAALLIFRRLPEQAIQYTLQMLQAHPNVPDAVMNHAGALMINGRLTEAAAQLDRVNPLGLDPRQLAEYHLWRCDLYRRLGQTEKAESHQRKIDETLLWPAQRRWLAELSREPSK